MGFPDSSVGKESSCNAGDTGSIPGSGRSSGEGIGYSLQYSCPSLVAQLVKNPPAEWRLEFDPWVGKIPWRRKGYPPQYSGLENFMDCTVHGVAKSWTRLSENDFHSLTSADLRLHWGFRRLRRTDPLSTAQCAHARAHTHAHTHTHTHGKYCKVYYWFTQEDKVNVCFFPLCHLTG